MESENKCITLKFEPGETVYFLWVSAHNRSYFVSEKYLKNIEDCVKASTFKDVFRDKETAEKAGRERIKTKMRRKKDRTLEMYKRAGAEMRLLIDLLNQISLDVSKVVSVADYNKLQRAIYYIECVRSDAEDNMFKDFPNIEGRDVDVFYGSVKASSSGPRGEIDAEQIELAKQIANELFGEETA